MYEAECFFEALSEKLDVVLENNEGRDILFVGNICQLTIEIPLNTRKAKCHVMYCVFK